MHQQTLRPTARPSKTLSTSNSQGQPLFIDPLRVYLKELAAAVLVVLIALDLPSTDVADVAAAQTYNLQPCQL